MLRRLHYEAYVLVAADITTRMCQIGLTESLVWAHRFWPLYASSELLAAAYRSR